MGPCPTFHTRFGSSSESGIIISEIPLREKIFDLVDERPFDNYQAKQLFFCKFLVV
jgi:hypothetical protein